MDFLVHHMLRTSAGRFPGKEALVHADRRLSYEDVAGQTGGLAHGLRSVGLRRGDRIGVYLEPSVAQVLSFFAISQAGGVFVPVNKLLFPEQVAHIANDCCMKALITNRTKLGLLEPVLERMPSLEFMVVPRNGECPPARVPTYVLEELCESPPPAQVRDYGIEKDLVAILYTSGSTGKPKGVMLNHAQIMAGSSIVSTYLEISAAERILAALPFSFDAGLNQLMTAFQQAGTLVLIDFVFAQEVVQALLKERITGLAGVPTLWSMLVQPNSTLLKHRFPDLRYITNTGGAMPQGVLAVLRRALSTTKIFLMYGLTEAFRSTYLPPEELDRRPTSIGKAIPNTEILVVDERGRPCGPGEVGDLVHCYSGDLVKMDEAGFLYFVGRRDTLIKSSGFRISPTEVEEVLFQSGRLQGVAVIGIPDEVLGQSVKAFVVPRAGEALDRDDLVSFCAERMPRYMVPKEVEVLEALPKTPSGKVDYVALRRRAGP
ncbi:MAG: hypothetical protein DMD69_14335 [Gemmatimonadetes bacterium]|nr:MAG: hypothetical protein DMD69_14335 [Gemmatimonadota bacterium]